MMYIHHHLGLGDHIVCNGLVRHILSTIEPSESIMLAVKTHNYSSVEHLYKNTRIVLDSIENDGEAESHYNEVSTVLRVGFEYLRNSLMDWEKSFYNQLGLDYAKRFSDFYIERNFYNENKLIEKLNLPDKFAFCNLKTSTGSYDIKVDTELPIIHLEPMTPSIFDWIGVLERSSEIHTVDSSIFQLIKQLPLNARKVFYDLQGLDLSRTVPTFEDNSWEMSVK